MRTFDIVVAATPQLGIGKNGTIPWTIRADLNFFKKVTTETKDQTKKNACIMGRKTYFSIPPKFRPLPNRYNIVLSKDPSLKRYDVLYLFTSSQFPQGVFLASSLEEAFKLITTDPQLNENVETVFVIGGSQVYEDSIKRNEDKRSEWICNKIYFTLVQSPHFECDTFFPKIKEELFKLVATAEEVKVQEENQTKFQFLEYVAKFQK